MRDVALLVIGALLGLVGSTVGSILIGRIELRRSTRVRVLETILPRIESIESGHHQIGDLTRVIFELRRACLLLSRREMKVWRELRDIHQERAAMLLATSDERDVYGNRMYSVEVISQNEDLYTVFSEKLSKFENLLAVRLNRRWRSRRSLMTRRNNRLRSTAPGPFRQTANRPRPDTRSAPPSRRATTFSQEIRVCGLVR